MNDIPVEQSYDLIFEGRLVVGRHPDDVQRAFAERFGDTATQAVFGNLRVILKRDVPRTAALDLQRLFEQLGMVSTLLPKSMEAPGLSLEDGSGVSTTTLHKNAVAARRHKKTPAAEPKTIRPVAAERANKPRAYTPAELDAAFVSPVARPRGSLVLPLALIPVAGLMVLLPLIYVGLVALVGYGVYLWAANGLHWIAAAGVIWIYFTVPIFVTILLGGILLLVFLLRPFVTHPTRELQPVVLDPHRDTALFHLVEKIAASVGAPTPTQILLDASVNASASLRRGIFSRHLTLTIGAPLLYGMNVQTLAGILAHEFGHFAQGISTRLYHIISRINYWFHSKTKARDNWDEWIVELLDSDSAIMIFAATIAAFGTWLCRRILAALARVGFLFSFALSRQMEFDADRYEIALTGSEQFAETARRLNLLSVAYGEIKDELDVAYDGGKLVDNMPRWVAHRADEYPHDVCKRIYAAIALVNRSVYDTHPPDQARIRKAVEAKSPATFVHEGPASRLLGATERLAQQVTLQWYRGFGFLIGPDRLLPLDAVRAEAGARTRAQEAAAEFLGPLVHLTSTPELLPDATLANLDDAKLIAALDQRVKTLGLRSKEFQRAIAGAERQDEAHEGFELAYFYNSYDVPFDLAQFGLSGNDREVIERKLDASAAEVKRVEKTIDACVKLLGERLSIGLELALRRGRAARDALLQLRFVHTALARGHNTIWSLYKANSRVRWYQEALSVVPDDARLKKDLADEVRTNNELQIKLFDSLESVPDPLNPGHSIADALPNVSAAYFGRGDEDTALCAARMLRHHGRLRHNVFGLLAAVALQGEAAVRG